jgi:IclR family acetate operon transcriptional repressor
MGRYHVSEKGYLVKPVYKALAVLECLAAAGRPLTLTEVSYLSDLPKTTVFKYLYTLRERGFVAHNEETDRYAVGLRVWELGKLAGDELRVREVALPFMYELRDRFNETVNLGILDGKDVVYVEMVESRHALLLRARLGGRDPVYSTSLGKAMLAFVSQERRREHLPSRLSPRTPRTITSFKVLDRELEQVRLRGFARDEGENEDAARCIGAPIFDHSGAVTAAISFSAPAIRVDQAREQEVIEAALGTASKISRRLGYMPDGAPVEGSKRAIS